MSRLRPIITTLPLLAALSIAGLMLVPPLLGYQRYVIVGSSMTGTIDRGSIVYDRPVPVANLRVGDVITYTPPAGAGPRGLVTHRIVWIGRDRHGARAFRTMGDANRVADPWRFVLRDRKQARVAFHVPYVGYALAALSLRPVRMALIGLPALLLALAVLSGLWREAGEEARRRAEPEAAT
jgi:signal peptidase